MTCRDPLQRAEGTTSIIQRRRGAALLGLARPARRPMRRLAGGLGRWTGSELIAYPFQTPACAHGFIRGVESRARLRADQRRSVLPDDDRAFRLGPNLCV